MDGFVCGEEEVFEGRSVGFGVSEEDMVEDVILERELGRLMVATVLFKSRRTIGCA